MITNLWLFLLLTCVPGGLIVALLHLTTRGGD